MRRRGLLLGTAGLTCGLASAMIASHNAWAAPAPLGIFPEGSSGPSVFVGLSTPLTGTYAAAGTDVLFNVNFGNDAVGSIKQAKQFGILDRMTLVMPYMSPFLFKEVGADLMAGVYGTTEFWWTLGDKNPIAQAFVDSFSAKYGYKPEWAAHVAYMQVAPWAVRVLRQTGDAVALEAAVQVGACQLWDAVTQTAEHIVKRQECPPAELDHHGLLGEGQHGTMG